MPAHFALFETAIGTCAIVWTERGVSGLQLPERDATATRARITRQLPDAVESEPQPEIRSIIAKVVSLIAGADINLRDIPLDLEGLPDFDRRVYDIARSIPPGETMTYGEIAARLDDPGIARAVGQALGKNPVAVIVPCHRVLAAGGRIGGFSANGGVATKRRLLAIESAHCPPPLFRAAQGAK